MNGATEPSIVEKSIAELEIDDGELRTMRERLVAEKTALQSELAELNSKCATRIDNYKYQTIQNRRAQVVKQVNDKEAELAELNARRTELNTVMQVRKRQAHRFVPSDVRQIVAIRDKWHAFSMDASNHQKAREIAWKVSQELREFLKPHFRNEVPADS